MDERALKEWLLWCRENRFRVREIQHGDLRMVVDDLGEKPPQEPPKARSVHEAFAAELGIEYSEDDEDRPDPVEGHA
jgi:hypothetical protein